MNNVEIVETVLRAVLKSDGLTDSECEATMYNIMHGYKAMACYIG